jgi:hypothetical protein
LAGSQLNLLLRLRLLLLLQPHAVQMLLQLLLPVIIIQLVTIPVNRLTDLLLCMASVAGLSRVAAPLAAL